MRCCDITAWLKKEKIVEHINTILSERDYPSQLIDASSQMLFSKKFEISLVTAQMACEVCTERVIRAFLVSKNLSFLHNSISELLPSYNLSNDKVRKLYSSITDDLIQQQHFWSEYKTLVSLRNKAVHGGSRIQESQAQMGIRVAKLMIKHLQQIETKAHSQQA